MFNTKSMNGFMNSPACPASHPIRMPQVAYETVWDTRQFNSLWAAGTPNPFVWSFEGTGAGTHADYLFGYVSFPLNAGVIRAKLCQSWKGDSLQRAIDRSECFYDGCGSIKKQAMSLANQCTIKETVKEETNGCKFISWFDAILLSATGDALFSIQ